jgi:hypothetical protein
MGMHFICIDINKKASALLLQSSHHHCTAARRKRRKSEGQGFKQLTKTMTLTACLGMASNSPQFPGLEACTNGCKSVLHSYTMVW